MISTLGNISMKTDYAEMVRRSLEPEHSVLIAVDIQEKLLPPIFEKDRLVKNSQLLIRLAGLLDIPVIVSTQYAKGLGGTVPTDCVSWSPLRVQSTKRCSRVLVAMCFAQP